MATPPLSFTASSLVSVLTCALAMTSNSHVEVSHVTKAAVARVGTVAM